MRKRATPPRTPPSIELWPTLEADDSELIAHVDRRLGRAPSEPPLPGEPAWLAETLEAAWPRLLRDADRDARP